MKDEIIKINSDKNMRIDKFMAQRYPDYSRSYIQKLINDNNIKVNKEIIKNSYKLRKGDVINITEPEPKELELEPYELELNIIYEDKNMLVVNKPADLLVHPSPHENKKTLVNALLNYTDDLSGIGGVKRPGIVHRLDKDTSGTIVVAKDDKSHKNLIKQFKNRKTKKIYQAIVLGNLDYNDGKINAPIGRDPNNRTRMAVVKHNSKKAVTYFKVINRNEKYTYLELELKTGRTHQIRVHLSYLGHPILGDEKYGENDINLKSLNRQMLHSYKLGFYHPIRQKWMEFKADLPQDFKEVQKKINL